MTSRLEVRPTPERRGGVDPVLVPVTAAAAVAAAVVAGAAMLAGAHRGAPADPALAALVGPVAAPAPPGHADRVRPPVDPSASTFASGSASAAPSPSMATPSAAASPFASGAVWAAVNCAEVRIRVGGGGPPTDAGGPLVPPGASTVTRCETPVAATRWPFATTAPPRPFATTAAPRLGAAAPKVLTSGVDRFTAVLNALPPVPPEQACLPITLPVQLSLVFTFPEQQPLAVIVDPTCSALVAGERARSYAGLNPLPVFDALHGAQPSPS